MGFGPAAGPVSGESSRSVLIDIGRNQAVIHWEPLPLPRRPARWRHAGQTKNPDLGRGPGRACSATRRSADLAADPRALDTVSSVVCGHVLVHLAASFLDHQCAFASHSVVPEPFPGPTNERLSPAGAVVNTLEEKCARLQGASGRWIHISRCWLHSQHWDGKGAADGFRHGADARRQLSELVERQGLRAVGERLVRAGVDFDHQAVGARRHAG